nr:MAG TPA_asm: hypothetical protein [Bacteriophage sp.]
MTFCLSAFLLLLLYYISLYNTTIYLRHFYDIYNFTIFSVAFSIILCICLPLLV